MREVPLYRGVTKGVVKLFEAVDNLTVQGYLTHEKTPTPLGTP